MMNSTSSCHLPSKVFCFQLRKRKFDFFENFMLKQFGDFRFLAILERIWRSMEKFQLNVVFLNFAYYLIYLFCSRVSYSSLIYYLMDEKDLKVSYSTVAISNCRANFSKDFHFIVLVHQKYFNMEKTLRFHIRMLQFLYKNQ